MFPLLFVPGMTYSQSNYETCSSFPCDSMNVFWNSKMMEMVTRPMLYSYQSYDYNNFMPYQYNFGFDLLNPTNFAQQWMNQNQGQYQYNMGTNWGGFPYAPGNGPTNPAGNGGNSNKLTSAEKQEIKDLEAILKAYKNITKNSKIQGVINDALATKYGTERLEALHKAYKEIPEADIKKTLMVMQENKVELEKTGYAFGGDYSYKNDNDTQLKKDLNTIKEELESLEGKDGEYVTQFYNGIWAKYDILRVISYWNDENNDAKTRSIINLVFKNVDELKGEDKKKAFDTNVKPLVTALVNKAIDVADVCENDSTVAKIENAKKQLNDATEKGLTNKANIIKAFEELYIVLRKAEAERMNEEFNNKYEFLNDIDSDDTDIITKKLIIEDTEKDLAKEFKDNTTLLTSSGFVVNGNANVNGNNGDDEKPETEKTAYQNGVALSNSMTKKRTAPKNRKADEALSTVNSGNVVGFLDGLYSEKKRNYFERMDKREGKGQIDMDARKNLIKSVLDAAEKAGVDKNSDAYRKLNEIYEEYTEHNKTDKTDFKSKNTDQTTWWNFKDKSNVFSAVTTGAVATGVGATIGCTVANTAILGTAFGGPFGTLVGGVIGLAIVGIGALATLCFGKVSDAEVVDSCIKELYEEIKMNEQVKKEEKTETTDVQA